MASTNPHSVSIIVFLLLSSNFLSVYGHFVGDTCNRTSYPSVCLYIFAEVTADLSTLVQMRTPAHMILFALLDGAERAGKYAESFKKDLDDGPLGADRESALKKCKGAYENIKSLYKSAHESYVSHNNGRAKGEVEKVASKIDECRRSLSGINAVDREGPFQRKVAKVNVDLIDMD